MPKSDTFNNEYGSQQQAVAIASAETDYRLLYPADGSEFSSPLGQQEYSDITMRLGPPPNDSANGRARFYTGGRATCELIGFARGTADSIYRARIFGWRPLHPQVNTQVTSAKRASAYSSVLFVRRPLAEITLTLGTLSIVAGSTDGSGISTQGAFAKTIAKVGDYTWSQNARVLGSGLDDVAAFYFDCSGFPIVEVAGSRDEVGSSGPSSGPTGDQPQWFNFLYALG